MSSRGRGRGNRGGRPPRERDWRYVPSVSRSGGLERDGDALTKFSVQEDYYKFISDKLATYQLDKTASPAARKESVENLSLMYRKLREGLLASKRTDSFVSQVYETSAYLTVIMLHDRHPASPILSHLLFELTRPAKQPGTSPSPVAANALYADAALIYLLDVLVSNLPSQSAYMLASRRARTAGRLTLPVKAFLQRISTCLRHRDYILLERILRPDSKTLSTLFDSPHRPANPSPLFRDALDVLMAKLVSHVRESSWTIIRTAYREVALDVSGDWLSRCLLLRDSQYEGPQPSGKVPSDFALHWLDEKSRNGEATQTLRDGNPIPGRWTLRRPQA